MEASFDLAVVGAGPGGCAAVAAAAAGGLSVVWLERGRHPRQKPCAGGLTVKALGVLPPGIEDTWRATFPDVEFGYRGGAGAGFGTSTRFLATVHRPEFDAALARRAAEAPGVELREGTKVREVHREGEGFRLETSAGDVVARQLVAADGANGVCRRLGLARPAARAVALEVDVPLESGWRARPRTPAFDFGVVPRGYGWVFPKDGHATVGIYSLAHPLREARDVLFSYLASKGYAAPDGGLPLVQAHTLPVGGVAPRRPDLPAYPVGDAAGVADALLGEGIFHALESGRLAGETAVRVARGEAAPAEYGRRLAERVLPDTRVTWWTARLVYAFPRLALWLLVRAGVARPFVQGYGEGATFAECCWRAPLLWARSFRAGAVKPAPRQALMEP